MIKGVRNGAVTVMTLVGSLALTGGCALFGAREAGKAISMNELPAAVRPLV